MVCIRPCTPPGSVLLQRRWPRVDDTGVVLWTVVVVVLVGPGVRAFGLRLTKFIRAETPLSSTHVT